jgi:hypothetical protein
VLRVTRLNPRGAYKVIPRRSLTWHPLCGTGDPQSSYRGPGLVPSAMTIDALRLKAKELYPQWSESMIDRWVTARLAAPGIKPIYKQAARTPKIPCSLEPFENTVR